MEERRGEERERAVGTRVEDERGLDGLRDEVVNRGEEAGNGRDEGQVDRELTVPEVVGTHHRT